MIIHMIYHLLELQHTRHQPQTVTMSLAASHRRLMLLFPVIKLSPPCCCVKRRLNCQLGLGVVSAGPFFFVPFVVSVMWPVEFFMASMSLKQLVRRKNLTALWFCYLSKCRPATSSAVYSCAGRINWHLVIFKLKVKSIICVVMATIVPIVITLSMQA